MIDGEQRGPFLLEELAAAGVGPDTYVWCKGMDNWEKAEDVADICRLFRQRIFDIMHPSRHPSAPQQSSSPEAVPNAAPKEDPYAGVPLQFRRIMHRSQTPPPENISDPEPDITVPPSSTLFISIFLTLFCFPITGLVAVYYSYKARATWMESLRGEKDKAAERMYGDTERQELRRQAHEYGRKARMWMWITFFLSFILYAVIGHRAM